MDTSYEITWYERPDTDSLWTLHVEVFDSHAEAVRAGHSLLLGKTRETMTVPTLQIISSGYTEGTKGYSWTGTSYEGTENLLSEPSFEESLPVAWKEDEWTENSD